MVVTAVCIELELKNCLHKYNAMQLPVFARSMQTTLRDRFVDRSPSSFNHVPFMVSKGFYQPTGWQSSWL